MTKDFEIGNFNIPLFKKLFVKVYTFKWNLKFTIIDYVKEKGNFCISSLC